MNINFILLKKSLNWKVSVSKYYKTFQNIKFHKKVIDINEHEELKPDILKVIFRIDSF